MSNHSSKTGGSENTTHQDGRTISLDLPVQEADLFKHGATPHILNFLSDNPDINLSLKQLSRLTPVTERATRKAVDTLVANDLVETFHNGTARRVQINKTRLTGATDPVLTIPQTEFHTPVRVAQHYIEHELEDVQGIILFGSVAQGTADRQSDIDLWVLVATDHMQQRHEANKLVTHLEDLQIPPTIAVADAMTADFDENWTFIKELLEDDDQHWASADRYSFEILVETPQSIIGQRDRVDAEQLFGQGITLHFSETLERIKMEVLNDD